MSDKVLIEDLVEYKWTCPFDIKLFEILLDKDSSKKLMYQFFSLCAVINYEFHSPGNSFKRNLINILNRKFHLNHLIRACSIREKCKKNQDWLTAYDHLIDALIKESSKIKFRKLEENTINRPLLSKNEILLYFRSDILNEEGIILTYNSFL